MPACTACTLTLYSTRSVSTRDDEPRSRGDTRSLVSTPLAGATLGTQHPAKWKAFPAYYSLRYDNFTCNMRFRKKRLRTPCFQENVDPFCRVLELPAAAQGVQQLFCTLAVVIETPGPPGRGGERR